jgi:acyl-CoA thioesterase FadM
VQYRKPLQFDEEVDVSLWIGAVTRTTFQVAYLLSVGGEARATAVTVHGCVDGRGRAARLPAWVGEEFVR